jgi:hypothetical protein
MMDHHCAWLNNCVGLNNLRYFLTLTFAAPVSTLYYIIYGFSRYYELMQENYRIYSPVMFFYIKFEDFCEIAAYNLGIGVTIVIGYYFVKMVHMISKGQSTLEDRKDEHDDTFNISLARSFEIYYGKELFPFMWAFVSFIQPKKGIDEVMRNYYGFE